MIRLGIGELKLRKKGLLPEMQLLAEMHFPTKVILLGTPRTLHPSVTMKTAVSVRRRRRMAKSSTKRSRSKGNSLPLTKRFDFTMVDDDFEESQRGFVSKETNADTKKCVKFFKDSASARNHHSSSTIKMVPNDILLTDTALQLLEVVIHHGVIKPLGGWKAVVFATRTLGRLGHSTSTKG